MDVSEHFTSASMYREEMREADGLGLIPGQASLKFSLT